ncbi:MAG TPA: DUF4157 domain-containing protein [Ktedonobacteraceae bacterium]|nr:DUF4157 domain-containing protein [Ktedonobacteraceae bacterium]
MRRHLLLKRQQQSLLANRLLKNQPLVQRIRQQQGMLPAVLGLYSVSTLTPSGAEVQPWRFVAVAPVDSIEQSEEVSWPLEVNLPTGSEQDTPALPTTLPTTIERTQANLPAARRATSTAVPPVLTKQSASLELPAPTNGADVPGEAILPDYNRADVPGEAVSPDYTGESLLPESSPTTLPSVPPPGQPGEFQQAERRPRLRVQELPPVQSDLGAPPVYGESESHEHAVRMPREDTVRATNRSQPPATRSRPERSYPPDQGRAGENMEELFAPRTSDRSPQTWLARLTRLAEAEQPNKRLEATPQVRTWMQQPARPSVQSQPDLPQARTPVPSQTYPGTPRQAESVAQQTRTFLKPLLGIDPAAVPIYRDAQASQATSTLNADALSTGDAIEIAPGHAETTPETLGLLAHELTHVARRQSPRFIPPVARPQSATPALASSLEQMDEETLALQVERRVRQAARGVLTRDTASQSVPALTQDTAEPTTNSQGNTSSSERGIWGNLPAPWEPLPDWLVNTPASSNVSTPTSGALPTPTFSVPIVTLQAPGIGQESLGSSSTETGIMRAGTERTVNDASEENTQTHLSPPAAKGPEPDLDVLARQVYNLLKRRLSVEQRRG